MNAVTFTAVIMATAYAPMIGGINGGACVGRPWEQCPYPTGTAACNRWPSGTRLTLPAWAADYGFPEVVTCRGGGGPAVDVDLALVSADAQADQARALAWGRRRITVTVELPARGRPPTRARAWARVWRMTARDVRAVDRMEAKLWNGFVDVSALSYSRSTCCSSARRASWALRYRSGSGRCWRSSLAF